MLAIKRYTKKTTVTNADFTRLKKNLKGDIIKTMNANDFLSKTAYENIISCVNNKTDFDFEKQIKKVELTIHNNYAGYDWNNEFYTPEYAIYPIAKYIKPKSIIWCPFDTEESFFVKIFRKLGHKVIATHISTGTDFFNCETPDCDYIISNPPYSVKSEVLKRLFDIGKSFAMLVGVVGIFESKKRFEMFKNNQFEVMYFEKRIAYFKSYNEQKPSLNPPFSSVYICHNILPKQIMFENLIKNDTTQLQMGV
jgi:hypothetical protein